jgi:hypothetical protein
MRKAVVVLGVLALANCTSPGTPPPVKSAEIQLEHATEQMQVTAIQQPYETGMQPYIEWTHEKPPTCASATLKKVLDSVLAAATLVNSDKHGFDETIRAGSWVLDVADGTKSRGCKELARDLYRLVIAKDVGTGYAGLRDRAAAGLADTR